MPNSKQTNTVKIYVQILILAYYVYNSFIKTFSQFFGFEKKTMEKFQLTSFESHIKNKYGFGISSMVSLKSIDMFKMRGDTEYNYFKIDDVFEMNKPKSVLPWLEPAPHSFLEYYRENPSMLWNRHKRDRFQKRSHGWFAQWHRRWSPYRNKRVRHYNNLRAYEIPTVPINKKKKRSVACLQKKKLRKLRTIKIPSNLKTTKKLPLKTLNLEKSKKVTEKVIYAPGCREGTYLNYNKWGLFRNRYKNKGIYYQLGNLDGARRLSRLMVRRKFDSMETWPIKPYAKKNLSKKPLRIRKGLKKYPYTKRFKKYSPKKMNIGIRGGVQFIWSDWRFKKTRRYIKKYKKYKKKSVGWLTKLNEIVRKFNYTKSIKKRDRYKKKNFFRRKKIKKFKKLGKNWEKRKLNFHNIKYRQAKKRSEIFRFIFDKITYNPPETISFMKPIKYRKNYNLKKKINANELSGRGSSCLKYFMYPAIKVKPIKKRIIEKKQTMSRKERVKAEVEALTTKNPFKKKGLSRMGVGRKKRSFAKEDARPAVLSSAPKKVEKIVPKFKTVLVTDMTNNFKDFRKSKKIIDKSYKTGVDVYNRQNKPKGAWNWKTWLEDHAYLNTKLPILEKGKKSKKKVSKKGRTYKKNIKSAEKGSIKKKTSKNADKMAKLQRKKKLEKEFEKYPAMAHLVNVLSTVKPKDAKDALRMKGDVEKIIKSSNVKSGPILSELVKFIRKIDPKKKNGGKKARRAIKKLSKEAAVVGKAYGKRDYLLIRSNLKKEKLAWDLQQKINPTKLTPKNMLTPKLLNNKSITKSNMLWLNGYRRKVKTNYWKKISGIESKVAKVKYLVSDFKRKKISSLPPVKKNKNKNLWEPWWNYKNRKKFEIKTLVGNKLNNLYTSVISSTWSGTTKLNGNLVKNYEIPRQLNYEYSSRRKIWAPRVKNKLTKRNINTNNFVKKIQRDFRDLAFPAKDSNTKIYENKIKFINYLLGKKKNKWGVGRGNSKLLNKSSYKFLNGLKYPKIPKEGGAVPSMLIRCLDNTSLLAKTCGYASNRKNSIKVYKKKIRYMKILSKIRGVIKNPEFDKDKRLFFLHLAGRGVRGRVLTKITKNKRKRGKLRNRYKVLKDVLPKKDNVMYENYASLLACMRLDQEKRKKSMIGNQLAADSLRPDDKWLAQKRRAMASINESMEAKNRELDVLCNRYLAEMKRMKNSLRIKKRTKPKTSINNYIKYPYSKSKTKTLPPMYGNSRDYWWLYTKFGKYQPTIYADTVRLKWPRLRRKLNFALEAKNQIYRKKKFLKERVSKLKLNSSEKMFWKKYLKNKHKKLLYQKKRKTPEIYDLYNKYKDTFSGMYLKNLKTMYKGVWKGTYDDVLITPNYNVRIVDKFWAFLEGAYGIKPKRSLVSLVFKNDFIVRFWYWAIRVTYLLLKNKYIVYFYEFRAKNRGVLFATKYLKYLHYNYIIPFVEKHKTIVWKVGLQGIVLVVTTVSYLTNTAYCELQNLILINISKITSIIEYISSWF